MNTRLGEVAHTRLTVGSSGFKIPSLLHLTIEEASQGLHSGQYTSVDLVKTYLQRIDETQKVAFGLTQAEINAVQAVNDKVLSQAAEMDLERAQSKGKG